MRDEMDNCFEGANEGQAVLDGDTILYNLNFIDYASAHGAVKELLDNSYSHGSATRFDIYIERNDKEDLEKVVFCDNGIGLLANGSVEDTRHVQTATGLKRNKNLPDNSIGHHGAGLLQFLVKYASSARLTSKHDDGYHVATAADPQRSLNRQYGVVDSSHKSFKEFDENWKAYNNQSEQGLMIEIVPLLGAWETKDLEEDLESQLSIAYTDRFKKDKRPMGIYINEKEVELKAFEDYVAVVNDESYKRTWTHNDVEMEGEIRLRIGKAKDSKASPFKRVSIALGGRLISQDSKFGLRDLRSANMYNYPGLAVHLDFDESFRSTLGVPPTKYCAFETGAADQDLKVWLTERRRGPQLRDQLKPYLVRNKPQQNNVPTDEEWQAKLARPLKRMADRAIKEPHDIDGLRGTRSSNKSKPKDSSGANESPALKSRIPSEGNPSRQGKYGVKLENLNLGIDGPYYETRSEKSKLTIVFDTSHPFVKECFYEKSANGSYKKTKDGAYVLLDPDSNPSVFITVAFTISLAQTSETHSDLSNSNNTQDIEDFGITLAKSLNVKFANVREVPDLAPPSKPVTSNRSISVTSNRSISVTSNQSMALN